MMHIFSQPRQEWLGLLEASGPEVTGRLVWPQALAIVVMLNLLGWAPIVGLCVYIFG
jgi:hypothetical protein